MNKPNHWIKFSTNAADIKSARAKLNSKFQIPPIVGALKGTHIKLRNQCSLNIIM